MLRYVTALLLLLGSLDLAAAITGFVIDENGKSIAGARVRAIALESSDAAAARITSNAPEPVAVATAQTGNDGAFRIDTKREPVVMLLVDAPGYAPATTDAIDGIDAGALLLRPATAKTGRVTANGQPVAGAWVNANNLFFTRTDERGEYTLADPARWVQTLIVTHPDFAAFQRQRTRDGMPLEVVLERGNTVSGRVVDPAGRPIANAVIRDTRGPLATSGEDGSFTIPHLASHVTLLRATAGSRVGSAKPAAGTIVLRPGGTITGTVRSTNDDTAVAGARVSLRGTPGGAMAVTDAKGNFVLDAVPPGATALSVVHPGFSGAFEEIVVTEGGRIERGLTVTPVARISGTVIDEERKPVSGARVGLTGMGPNTLSAPDGSFALRVPQSERALILDVSKPQFAPVMHGPVQIEAGQTKSGIRITLPRGARVEIRLTDAGGVAIASEPVTIMRRFEGDSRARQLTVRCGGGETCKSDAEGKLAVDVVQGAYDIRAGGETTVAKELRAQTLSAAASPLTIELERGATVEGRVVWSDGMSFTTNATVIAGSGLQGGGSTQVSNGAFTLRSVPAGPVLLTLRLGQPYGFETEPVEVTAPATGVVLKVPRPGHIEGRVIDRETQRPVRQFTVTTERRGGRRSGFTPTTFTSDDGRFKLQDVPPGAADLTITASGYVRATSSAVDVPEGKTATVEVPLDRAATIAGRVTSGGRPVSGVTVAAEEPRARIIAPSRQTDANGEFRLDTVLPGTRELRVRKEGFIERAVSVEAVVGKETRIDIELARGRELQVRVVDSLGHPVAGATVGQRAPKTRSFTYTGSNMTDTEGMFRLDGLGDEAVEVFAHKDGYVEGTAEVNPATAASVTITLSRGGTISGRVIGVPREELPMIEVYAFGFQKPTPARTTVDATGAFTLSGLSDGQTTVIAEQMQPRRRTVRSGPVTIAGGTGPFVELDFSAGFTVRGRVTRGGQPVVRGLINFSPADPRNRALHGSGGDIINGRYEAQIAAAGEYRVHVTPVGEATMDMPNIAVRGEMVHDIDIRGAMLRGRVVDAATGMPMPNVRVHLYSTGRGTDRTTDSAGHFSFDFVADGKYTVRPQKEGYTPESREVMVQGGVVPEVELSLTRGEPVEIRVIDAATRREIQAYVSVGTATREAPGVTTQRSPDGLYRYWLRPGTYAVHVFAERYTSKTLRVTVPGPAVVVELEPKR